VTAGEQIHSCGGEVAFIFYLFNNNTYFITTRKAIMVGYVELL
jgi:hypothetical protein